MEEVTAKWIQDRGGLHDARVVDALWVGPNVELALDDVWANERGLRLPLGNAPGTLVLQGASLQMGDIGDAVAGWISEITLVGHEVHIAFFNRSPLCIGTTGLLWSGAEQHAP